MSRRTLEYFVRHNSSTAMHGPYESADKAVTMKQHLMATHESLRSSDYDVVARVVSPFVKISLDAPLLEAVMPRVECSHCRGFNLGFGLFMPTGDAPRIYEACNDCGEIMWSGTWEQMVTALEFIYGMRIPTLD